MKRDPIVLDELEQECFDKYTARIWTSPYKVGLTIGGQLFGIDAEPEDATHAEWFRSMLAKALARIIEADHLSALRTKNHDQP